MQEGIRGVELSTQARLLPSSPSQRCRMSIASSSRTQFWDLSWVVALQMTLRSELRGQPRWALSLCGVRVRKLGAEKVLAPATKRRCTPYFGRVIFRCCNRPLSHANPDMKKICFCSERWAELLYRRVWVSRRRPVSAPRLPPAKTGKSQSRILQSQFWIPRQPDPDLPTLGEILKRPPPQIGPARLPLYEDIMN